MGERADRGERVVLVTGHASGIGRATAQCFAARGWRVIGFDRAEGDVASEADWTRTLATETRLDALVHNAAVQLAAPVTETSAADWDTVMAINVRAVFLGVKHALPLLSAARGAVVNVASVHAVATSTGIAAYAASKGAVLALTRALAVELAPMGVRVNAVLPGAVDTDMLRAGLGRGHVGQGTIDERLEALARRTVLGRVGTPEEIARAIVFLADDHESSFVTGQGLIVDGGATARLSTE